MINRVLLAGRLGKDPELKYTQTQQPVARFSLATSEKRKGADGQMEEHTEWHNIIVWGKTAEFCNQYLAKGRKVFIEGKIGTRSWEKDGQKHSMIEITAQNVQFIDSPPKTDLPITSEGPSAKHRGMPTGTSLQASPDYSLPSKYLGAVTGPSAKDKLRDTRNRGFGMEAGLHNGEDWGDDIPFGN